MTLEEFSEYIFKVTFQNIFAKQGTKTYTVTTSTYDSPLISIVQEPPLVFFAFNRITIVANVFHMQCKNSDYVVEIKD